MAKLFANRDAIRCVLRQCFPDQYYDNYDLEDILFDNQGRIIWELYFREMRVIAMLSAQKAEYDSIVGCLSYCSVWYNMELGYDETPTLFTISDRYLTNRLNFPDDYIWHNPEQIEDDNDWDLIHAFENLDINADANVRNNTEVTIYVRLPGLTYSVEVFKIENGMNWRNRRWYRYHYKQIFFKHTSFDDIKEL